MIMIVKKHMLSVPKFRREIGERRHILKCIAVPLLDQHVSVSPSDGTSCCRYLRLHGN